MNHLGLFYGFDGEFDAGLMYQYAEFVGTVTGFTSDLIRGLGNVVFPLDPNWFPSYLLAATGSGALVDYPLSYTVGATELFAAIVLFAWVAGFRPIVALAAAWLVFFTIWQIAGHPVIENIMRYFPPEGELLTVGCLVSAAVLRLGQGGLLRSLMLAAAVFGGIVFIALAGPGDLMLCVPGWCAFGAAALFVEPTRREMAIKLASAAVLCAAAFGTGLFSYFHGLFGYAAANVFPAPSERPHILWDGEVSLLLLDPISGGDLGHILRQLFTPVRLFVGGGLIGAVYALFSGPLYVRRMACGVLLAEAVYLLIGIANYLVTFWFAPSISYFESFSFPYLAFGGLGRARRDPAVDGRWQSGPRGTTRRGRQLSVVFSLSRV